MKTQIVVLAWMESFGLKLGFPPASFREGEKNNTILAQIFIFPTCRTVGSGSCSAITSAGIMKMSAVLTWCGLSWPQAQDTTRELSHTVYDPRHLTQEPRHNAEKCPGYLLLFNGPPWSKLNVPLLCLGRSFLPPPPLPPPIQCWGHLDFFFYLRVMRSNIELEEEGGKAKKKVGH